ncbi:MAG: bifunctional (p)ppGpp synthetase/guanosine-3',5'-bis(diphosphate) 3'-pyrophosphohydrolase [Candidatus Eisenbacteria sp.]|nr:bifunctional (p)ppGpp synthetase/guanosine-3',5'-bis(diphosphate) 3'-pyrophosphohydrolase [Candidatus Eisenbacteria bacterium]
MDQTDIERARQFATEAHDGQYRKSTRVPYIEHPMRVARMLEKMNAPPEVIAAGWLHDTTEDTRISPEDLRREFGEKVADIVAGASEPDKSLTWERRKRGTIKKLRTVALESALVSAADKIDNLRSTAKDLETIGEGVWKRFKRGRDKQEWYHRGVLGSLRENPNGIAEHELLSTLEREIERVFGS